MKDVASFADRGAPLVLIMIPSFRGKAHDLLFTGSKAAWL